MVEERRLQPLRRCVKKKRTDVPNRTAARRSKCRISVLTRGVVNTERDTRCAPHPIQSSLRILATPASRTPGNQEKNRISFYELARASANGIGGSSRRARPGGHRGVLMMGCDTRPWAPKNTTEYSEKRIRFEVPAGGRGLRRKRRI